jgi:hypothetical protein
MSLATKPKTDAKSRLNILQSGFRNFVGGVKIPISSDTRWLLEVVCLETSPISPVQTAPILEQTDYFLKNFLWHHQSQINHNREQWIASMKSNTTSL